MAIKYSRSIVSEIDNNRNSFGGIQGMWNNYEPLAIHYNNNTYIGSINSSGDIIVYKYNHSSGTITSSTVHSSFNMDDHSSPNILIRPDGKIQMFYCKHDNEDNHYFKISTNAEDISSFDALQTITTNVQLDHFATYCKAFYLSNESKYYLFWRGGNWQPTFSTSTDGITWETAKNWLYLTGRPMVYPSYASNGVDTIHMIFTNGHPTDVATNIYYCKYKNGNFYKADDTFICAIVDVPFGSNVCDLVYDSSQHDGYSAVGWDLGIDSKGYPVLVYQNQVQASGTDIRYRYARWNGSTWIDNEITTSGPSIVAGQPSYSSGICLDRKDPSIVYFGKTASKGYDMFKGITTDLGSTWEVRRICSNGLLNIRPTPVNGNYKDFGVLWLTGRYTSMNSFSMNIQRN